MAAKKFIVPLDAAERERLKALISKGKAPAKTILKARILLKADHLMRLVEHQDRAVSARAELLRLSEESTWDPGPDWKWNREEIYDRAGLRRHEHSDLRSVVASGGSHKKEAGE